MIQQMICALQSNWWFCRSQLKGNFHNFCSVLVSFGRWPKSFENYKFCAISLLKWMNISIQGCLTEWKTLALVQSSATRSQPQRCYLLTEGWFCMKENHLSRWYLSHFTQCCAAVQLSLYFCESGATVAQGDRHRRNVLFFLAVSK